MGISHHSDVVARLKARAATGTAQPRPVSSVREDLLTSAFGAWLVVGLFTDGWAHQNRPGLETFFTPWHALLYSGFTAGVVWLAVLAARNQRRGWSWGQSLPVGYPLAAVGVALFGAGGVTDMLWHLAFGVETGIDALLSPTHLLLLTGAALLLTAALRSGWSRPAGSDRPTLRAELPAVLSLSLVTALAAFFLIYLSVFATPAAATAYVWIPHGDPGHEVSELPVVVGLAGYLVTTVLLVVPLLLAERLGRRPVGLMVALVGVVAWLSAGADGFTSYGVAAAAAVTVAAAVVELLGTRIGRMGLPVSMRLTLLGAAVPVVLWTAQLLAVALTAGLRWPPELWSGVVVLSGMVGATLVSCVLNSWLNCDRG